ncbi:hypothetical protein ACFPIJ_07760 [Dactylosporangium cerinum]|uniref:Leucine-rich repeat domain-containing protein n=1 Tax=Dactylosporangium cerinum TaxID=1434730 RepID=A0ABV9VPL4_9ACTN
MTGTPTASSPCIWSSASTASRSPRWVSSPGCGSCTCASPAGTGISSRLEDLTLHNVTLAGTACLSGLPSPRGLALKLGATRDLSVLPGLPGLEFVELWQVRALDSIDVLGACPRLTTVFLQALARVQHLPDLSGTRLAHLHLERLTGLSDLTPLRSAPLQTLWLIDMNHLRRPHLEPLIGHPTLGAAVFGLGSVARNDEAERLLGLPEPDHAPFTRHAAGAMALPPLRDEPETVG